MSGSEGSRSFLVECYWPGVSEEKLADAVGRVREAAAALRREGRGVQFLGSILVPTDETVFCLFVGAEEDVRTVSEQADMPFERVLASLRIDGKQTKKEEQ